jgi:hypothetical protein
MYALPGLNGTQNQNIQMISYKEDVKKKSKLLQIMNRTISSFLINFFSSFLLMYETNLKQFDIFKNIQY